MSTAEDLSRTTLYQEIGRVVSVEPDGVRVATHDGVFPALVALSCVFQPEVGDEVALAVPARGDIYVQSILRREEGRELRMVSDRAVTWVLAQGISLVSKRSIDLASGEDIRMNAEQVEMRGTRARVFFETLESVTGSVIAESKSVRRVLGVLDSVVDRVSERIGRSYRRVEGIDSTRAGEIELRAEGVLNARARHSVISAEELVKLDGEQIHLG